MNAMWQPLMQAQVMKPAMEVMFSSQVNTVPPFADRFMNARRPKAEVKATATYGTPLAVVRFMKAGAEPSFARPRRIRLPE